eukprot:833355_1
MGIVFLAAWYMLHHTRLGRYIYALGGNEAATRLSGINVNKIKIIVYSLCGLLASLAGIIEVARLSSAQPTAGTGYELDAIAAVVLGGTSLAGKKTWHNKQLLVRRTPMGKTKFNTVGNDERQARRANVLNFM